jgi:hypothetical protein
MLMLMVQRALGMSWGEFEEVKGRMGVEMMGRRMGCKRG